MWRSLKKYWPIVILTALSILFFAKLFYPQSKIFVTPEFGMSDLWHYNLPSRFLLKEALSEGHLPLWTDKLGMGFPLFAEGQVAALSLVNLIPTLLFPAVTSFNLSFILIFLILSISTYLFCREIGISKEGALLSAITLTFSARIITQLNHPNILLAFAFLPVSLFLVEKYHKEKRASWLLVLSFVLSQQIFSGHLQMAFYCWIVIGGFWVFSLKSLKKPKSLIPLGLAVILALGLSAVQLLPSWEFMGQSNRATGLIKEIDAFPFRLKHLSLFLRPTIFGTPADASYPLNASEEGLFGENSVYIGLIPLVLAVLGIVWQIRKTVKKGKKEEKVKQTFFWILILVLSLLLALGRATPLFFVFKLPLMNFFRIPPRLLFFTVFALIILAGFGFDRLKEKLPTKFSIFNFQFSIFSLSFLLFTFFDLLLFSYNYHPAVSVSDWIGKPPATAQFLQKQQGEFRIVDAGSDPLWNQIFWHYGWIEQLERYKNLRNSLFTNSGAYYDIKSAGIYSGVQLRRIDEIFEVFKKELMITGEGKIGITEKGAKLLGAFSVKYFVSPVALASDDFALSFHYDPLAPEQEFAVFENLSFLPRARFIQNIIQVDDESGAINALNSPNFSPEKTTVVEGKIEILADASVDAKIINFNFSQQKIEISYESSSQNYLLLTDTFYPDWKAFVDGEETKIFPANLNSKLILAPKGEHEVEFVYQPESLRIGKIISMISLLIWGGALFYFGKKPKLKFLISNRN